MDMRVALMLLALILGIASTLPYCYFSTRLSTKLFQLSGVAYQMLWYHCPITCQKDVLKLIIYAQRERTVSGFGVINCTQQVFAKVNNEIL